jgi:endonuclease/exonuclease/phosphatase (EEP) superfamily protein YafD
MRAHSVARPAGLVEAAALLIGLAFVGARFPGRFPLLDNLSNFPAHFGIGFLACAALLAWRGRRVPAVGAAAAAVLAFAPVLPWYFGADAETPGAARQQVEILVANVYYANRKSGRVRRLVTEVDPDVVGLIEVNERWLLELGQLRERYPFHFEVADEHHVGLALYSRLPMTGARTVRFGDASSPAIAATLTTPAGEVEILLVHPASPVDAGAIRRRNAQIRALAQHVRDAGRPTVLAGDLNLSMWNPGYRPLEDVAEMHNARAGHGIGPTWPAIGRLGVPIDHILATPDVRLRSFRLLRRVGSDHRPIAAGFALR